MKKMKLKTRRKNAFNFRYDQFFWSKVWEASIKLALFVLLIAEQCYSYHYGTDKAKEMSTSLYTLFAIFSIWNSSWMYFYICYKKITVLVTRFNFLSSWRVKKIASKTELGKRFECLIGKGLFNVFPQC